MTFQYDDGGRYAAGFHQPAVAGDCITRAAAIAAGRPYAETHEGLTAAARLFSLFPLRSADHGVPAFALGRWMRRSGFRWVRAKGVGLGDPRFARGRYIVIAAIKGMRRGLWPVGHAFAVVDGAIRDTFDPRGLNLQIVGYWERQEAGATATTPLADMRTAA